MGNAALHRRRLSAIDWILIAIVGVGVVIAGAVGISGALDRANGEPDVSAPGFFVSGAFGHGDTSRAGVDPYAPPGLPAGVVIDRETGRMTGFSLPDEPDAAALRWETIDLEYDDGVDDIPDRVRDLDGRRVVMVGFLKAIYSITDIREFLLVGSHLACCFGTIPGPGGMIMVELDPDEQSATMTVEPVIVRGTLRIAPVAMKGRRKPVLLYEIDLARVDRLEDG